MKKNKKLKATVLALQSMAENSEAKAVIIHNYYQWVVVQNNLIDTIYYMARLRWNKTDPANEPSYGLVLPNEHKNLENCFRNIKLAEEFVFKGTKATAEAVGCADHD